MTPKKKEETEVSERRAAQEAAQEAAREAAQAVCLRAAHISLGTLAANAQQALRELPGRLGLSSEQLVADLRADAYGHGLAAVAGPLAAAGFRSALLSAAESDGGDAARTLVAAGLEVLFEPQPGSDIPGLVAEPLYGLLDVGPYRPVMRLSGLLLLVKTVPAGSGISYCWTYRTSGRTRLGLVSLGYADGLPFRSRGEVSVGGRICPVRGRIAMDHTVVELEVFPEEANPEKSHHAEPPEPEDEIKDDEVKPGAEVVFWGDPLRGEPSAASWAKSAGITPLALPATLSWRVDKFWAEI